MTKNIWFSDLCYSIALINLNTVGNYNIILYFNASTDYIFGTSLIIFTLPFVEKYEFFTELCPQNKS